MKKTKVVGDLYGLLFADGKLYIGACTYGARRRFVGHRREASAGRKTLVYEAWRKLGEPKLIILKTGMPEKDLWLAEKEAVSYYNTQVPYGYNSYSVSGVSPGSLGKPLSSKAKKKRYQKLLERWEDESAHERQKHAMLRLYQEHPEERGKRGRPRSKKQREKQSQVLIEYYKNNPVSEEIGKKISKALSGKPKSESAKKNIRAGALLRWARFRKAGERKMA